jgi:5-aminolevulinate synthase
MRAGSARIALRRNSYASRESGDGGSHSVAHRQTWLVILSDTHIVPVAGGDPADCKAASDLLLSEHDIYIQPINYPTVAKGTERLRSTPTPCHEDIMIDRLAAALFDVWNRLGLPRDNLACAAQ